MPEVKLHYKSPFQSEATFEGVIEPDGITGYKFTGILTAHCRLDRSRTTFKNTVRLGHGGTAAEYQYVEKEPEGHGDNSFKVRGEGKRAPNETVDFRLGFNEGLSGQFSYGDKISLTPGGPWQKIQPLYITKDGLGNSKYDVRFDGKARADGPDHFVIEGTFDASSAPGALTTQHAKFGYKASSGAWLYKTYDCNNTPQELNIVGSRAAGDRLQVQVGATSEVLNLYGYGSEVSCELPDKF